MKHIENSHLILKENEEKNFPTVVLESRFTAPDIEGLIRNKKFTLACMRDCLLKGEAPYASHVIYAQTHVLDDFNATERALGMQAGFMWGAKAEKTVVYTDLGLSSGMKLGIEDSLKQGRPVEYRELGFIPSVSLKEIEFEKLLHENQASVLEEIKSQMNSKIKRPKIK